MSNTIMNVLEPLNALHEANRLKEVKLSVLVKYVLAGRNLHPREIGVITDDNGSPITYDQALSMLPDNLASNQDVLKLISTGTNDTSIGNDYSTFTNRAGQRTVR